MLDQLFADPNLRNQLTQYALYLAHQYNETNEAKYRIKYNSLYPLLFHILPEERQIQFFDDFMNSLAINPIMEIRDNNIIFQPF